MKVELHVNGQMQVQLTAVTPIQALVLRTMLDAAAKGSAVRIAAGPCAEGDTSLMLSMEV